MTRRILYLHTVVCLEIQNQTLSWIKWLLKTNNDQRPGLKPQTTFYLHRAFNDKHCHINVLIPITNLKTYMWQSWQEKLPERP